MDRTLRCAVVLLSLHGSISSFVQRDMDGDVFVFQSDSKPSHVVLQPQKNEALRSFTICLRTFTDKLRPCGLFEYITHPPYYSEITIYKSGTRSYVLTVGAEKVEFFTPEVINKWVHLCFSWKSASGTARLWVDEVSLPRQGLNRGYVTKVNPSSELGKNRLSTPYVPQYNGEISHVFMWDYVLSKDEIKQGSFTTANILSWKNLTYNLIENVVIEPM